ncbi:hypothetical protein [Nostoc sp. MS1]|uniref:hypothetical protein n=1 Tax=Nostoc sp. MS1 TaxID=2764711 RepID=UPI001CC4AE27|nr:hypothetical protein [Nostoc sp. MS1]
MDNATQNSYTDIILVIDEAVALSDYLSDEQKQWIIRFLFTRASKKGAQIFVVLHGKNLTSWVGTKTPQVLAILSKVGLLLLVVRQQARNCLHSSQSHWPLGVTFSLTQTVLIERSHRVKLARFQNG